MRFTLTTLICLRRARRWPYRCGSEIPPGDSRQVFGALDVQSTQEAAFAEEDVAVLSTLADQIAIAIENARLFTQAQAALQEAEEAQRRYMRQEWAQLLTVMQSTSHEYHVSGVSPVGDARLPEIEQAIQQGRAVTVVGDGSLQPRRLWPCRSSCAISSSA